MDKLLSLFLTTLFIFATSQTKADVAYEEAISVQCDALFVGQGEFVTPAFSDFIFNLENHVLWTG